MDNDFTKLRLSSGLTLLVVPMKGVESVTMLAMVRTGSRDESEKLAGISHFLEHMVFKGTRKYRDAHAVTTAIDAVGGEFNAYTSKEFTGFYIKVASAHLKLGVEMLSELLVRPRLRSEDIERERGVIVEEINMYDDLPPKKVSDVYDRLLFGNTGLGRETIGSRESVRSLTKSDFRQYLRQRYSTGRVVLGIAGGVANGGWSVAKVTDLVSQSFSDLTRGKDGWGKPARVTQVKPALSLFEKQTGQAHFVLGVRAFRRGHTDRFALAVLATLLGGSASSRLFSEIREKRGLAYYVKSDTDAFFDTGSFNVSAGVEISKIGEAIRVVLEQFDKVSGSGSGGISEEELVRTKEYLKGRFILELEDSHEVADLYVRRFLLERKIITPRVFLQKIDAVTREDVIRVARTIFVSKNLNLAVIGPYSQAKDGQKFLKLLHL